MFFFQCVTNVILKRKPIRVNSIFFKTSWNFEVINILFYVTHYIYLIYIFNLSILTPPPHKYFNYNNVCLQYLTLIFFVRYNCFPIDFFFLPSRLAFFNKLYLGLKNRFFGFLGIFLYNIQLSTIARVWPFL